MSRLARLGYIDVRRTSDPVRRKVRSRGVPPALANNEIFYTEDVRAASRLIAKTLGPLQLTVGADEVPGFAATMHGVRLRNVSLLYLDLHVASAVDIPMLEYCAVGVAMGNADDAVKARANVVIGDNTTDSIAQYIYTHLL